MNTLFLLSVLSATQIQLDTTQLAAWDSFVQMTWGNPSNVDGLTCLRDADGVVVCSFSGKNRYLIAIGDSLTQGSTTAGGYPGLIISDALTVANLGNSGAVSTACGAQWKYGAKPFAPDYTVVLCGINDIKNNSFSTPQQAFNALKTTVYDPVLLLDGELWIISILPAKYHGGICEPNTGTSCPHAHPPSTPCTIDHGTPCVPALSPQDILDLNSLIQSYVATHEPDAHYIDAYPLFLTNPSDPTSYNTSLYYYEYEGDRNCDGQVESIYLHMSLAGRQVLADAVMDAMGL